MGAMAWADPGWGHAFQAKTSALSCLIRLLEAAGARICDVAYGAVKRGVRV